MSVSNPADAELRELVAKTLEEKGVLGKVKVTELSLNKFCVVRTFETLPYLVVGTAESECISGTSRTRFFNGESTCTDFVNVNECRGSV